MLVAVCINLSGAHLLCQVGQEALLTLVTFGGAFYSVLVVLETMAVAIVVVVDVVVDQK